MQNIAVVFGECNANLLAVFLYDGEKVVHADCHGLGLWGAVSGFGVCLGGTFPPFHLSTLYNSC